MAQSQLRAAVQNLFQTPELKDEDPLHAPLPAHLPDRRAHHGAGRERRRAGRLLPEPAAAAAVCSASTTCSPAAGSRARRCSRSASCRTSRPASSSRSPARWCRRSRRCRRTRKGGKRSRSGRGTLTVFSRRCRRAASRCSPSRCRAPSPTRASASGSQMVFFLTDGRDLRDVAGRADHRARHRQRRVSLIIFFSIVERIWPGIVQHVQLRQDAARSAPFSLVVLGIVMVAVVAGDGGDDDGGAAHPRSRSRSARWRAGGMREAAKNFIPLRINAAGRDADHLRAVDHRRAGRDRAVQRQRRGCSEIAELLPAGHAGCTTCCRRC